MSALLEGVHFARPGWLWALALAPLLAGLWQLRRRDDDVWRSAVDPHLLPHLVEAGAGRRGRWSLAGWMLALACAVLALAGPGWRQVPEPLHGAQAAPLVVALDLSSSASAADLPPSRLLQARAKLAALLAGRGEGEVALLAYADDAFTVAPLTTDAANLALYLDALAPDIMPADGQRASRAIEQATRLLRQRGASDGDILLVAGTVDSAALAEAATAARMGYRVSALGLGTPAGAAYRDGTGALAHARLDEAALRALAAAGGGRYQRLSADTADLQALGVLVPRTDQSAVAAGPEPGGTGTRRWADQGYWFVLPLLGLVLLAFRRGAGMAVVACVAMLPLWPAQGQDAPGATPWQRADQAAHAVMAEGIAHYRAGRYEEAARRWSVLPGADAAYNRGNALARQGELDAAIDAYDQALRLQPDMADALANRAAVDAARKRRPPPGPGEDPRAPPAPGEQDPGQGPPSTGDPAPGDATAGERGASGAPPLATGESPDPPAPPAGAGEAQREADAAQRERMERALEAGDARPDDGASESPALDDPGHERRQAGEAWLRRVPDDPGGLLRARFRLEHERRQQEGR